MDDDFEESSWHRRRVTSDEEDLYDAEILNADDIGFMSTEQGIGRRGSSIIRAARQQRWSSRGSLERDSFIPIDHAGSTQSMTLMSSEIFRGDIDLDGAYEEIEYQTEAFDEEDLCGGAITSRGQSQSVRTTRMDLEPINNFKRSEPPQYRPTVPLPSLSEATEIFRNKIEIKRQETERKAAEQKRILQRKLALEIELKEVSDKLQIARRRLVDLEKEVDI